MEQPKWVALDESSTAYWFINQEGKLLSIPKDTQEDVEPQFYIRDLDSPQGL